MSQAETIEDLPPVLTFLVRNVGAYSARRVWASFDTLRLRAIDDLFFDPGVDGRSILGFTQEPPHSGEALAISIPTQVALERFYFHVSVPTVLAINDPELSATLPVPQQSLAFTIPHDFDRKRVLVRSEVPAMIGQLSTDRKALKSPLEGAEKALRRGSFFESFFLAQTARGLNNQKLSMAWFFELFAFSFFGAAEDALNLYEEYPERGSADPWAQLLAARYRLLLRQFNEARTILHTLSFNPDLGALALCELARSYVIDQEFTRAIDTASAAIEKDRNYGESCLVRGLAHRGLAYQAGDIEGLREAHRDFGVVAKQGGYSAAEAAYHTGTVCARLGSLADAENAFRQSLFQRDRASARDALIRVLCAQGKLEEAAQELSLLEGLSPEFANSVREQVQEVLQGQGTSHTAARPQETQQWGELWASSPHSAVAAARALLRAHDFPIEGMLRDCAILDDCLNRFAPDGDFPDSGRFSTLRGVGVEMVARAIALHIADLLVSSGGARWPENCSDKVVIISSHQNMDLPLESFVAERILLGASGDNLSSLESLALEFGGPAAQRSGVTAQSWWELATPARAEFFREQAEWGRNLLQELGAQIVGNLGDLEEIDRVLEAAFEPGGAVQAGMPTQLSREPDRAITAIGLYLGGIIGGQVEVSWYDHDRAEGISILNKTLGRIFPIAKIQRRAFLASAGDFAARLSGLGWSVAVASVAEGIQSGSYQSAEQVRQALLGKMPGMGQFPDSELNGVVEALLIGATLK